MPLHPPPFMIPPPCLELKDSVVASNTQGIFCKEPIGVDTKFGPYVGEIVTKDVLDTKKKEIDFRYAWHVNDEKSSKVSHVINATVPEKGNWMRYVNSARFYEEQNIVSVQEGSNIYYKALKDIKPGEELLTWFGPDTNTPRKRKRNSRAASTPSVGRSSSPAATAEPAGNGKRLRKKKVSEDMLSLDDHDVLFASSGLHHNRIRNNPGSSSMRRSSSVNSARLLSSRRPDTLRNKPHPPPLVGPRVVTSTSPSPSTFQQTFAASLSTHTPRPDEIKPPLPTVQLSQPFTALPKGVKRPKSIHQIVDALKTAKTERSDPLDEMNDVEDVKPPKVLNGPSGGRNSRRSSMVGTAEYMEEHLATDHQFLFEVTSTHKSVPMNNPKRIKYACDICDGQYRKALSLKRHYLREHINQKYLSKDDVLLLNHQAAALSHKVDADVDPDADDDDVSDNPPNTSSTPGDDAGTIHIKTEPMDNDFGAQDQAQTDSNNDTDKPPTDSGAKPKVKRAELEENLKSKPLDGKKTFSYSGTDGVHDAFRCHLCVQLFPSVERLKYHLAQDSHRSKGDKQFACDRCSLRFRFSHNYQRHLDSHGTSTVELSTACHICGKKFLNEANMRKHLRFHSGRNFPCKYGCDVVYPNVAELVKHLRSFHPDLPKRSQLASTAGQDVAKKALLRRSVSSEVSPSPSQASLVVATMKTEEEAIQEHEALHPPGWMEPRGRKLRPGIVGVQCTICKKRFSTYNSMCRHRRSVHRVVRQAGEFRVVSSTSPSPLTLPAEEESYADVEEDPVAMRKINIEASVEEMYRAIEQEEARKEAERERLVFSPPPSPISFYENVADNIAENLSCYLDGGSEALKAAQQHIKVDHYVPLDEARGIEPVHVDIDWSAYNFPPFFLPVDPVIPNPPPPPPPPPPILTDSLLSVDGASPAYKTRAAIAEREATRRASAGTMEYQNAGDNERVPRRASVGALDKRNKGGDKLIRRASLSSLHNQKDTVADVTTPVVASAANTNVESVPLSNHDESVEKKSSSVEMVSSSQTEETVTSQKEGAVKTAWSPSQTKEDDDKVLEKSENPDKRENPGENSDEVFDSLGKSTSINVGNDECASDCDRTSYPSTGDNSLKANGEVTTVLEAGENTQRVVDSNLITSEEKLPKEQQDNMCSENKLCHNIPTEEKKSTEAVTLTDPDSHDVETASKIPVSELDVNSADPSTNGVPVPAVEPDVSCEDIDTSSSNSSKGKAADGENNAIEQCDQIPSRADSCRVLPCESSAQPEMVTLEDSSVKEQMPCESPAQPEKLTLEGSSVKEQMPCQSVQFDKVTLADSSVSKQMPCQSVQFDKVTLADSSVSKQMPCQSVQLEKVTLADSSVSKQMPCESSAQPEKVTLEGSSVKEHMPCESSAQPEKVTLEGSSVKEHMPCESSAQPGKVTLEDSSVKEQMPCESSAQQEKVTLEDSSVKEQMPGESSAQPEMVTLADSSVKEQMPCQSSAQLENITPSHGTVSEAMPCESSAQPETVMPTDSYVSEQMPCQSSAQSERVMPTDSYVSEQMPCQSSAQSERVMPTDSYVSEQMPCQSSVQTVMPTDSYVSEQMPCQSSALSEKVTLTDRSVKEHMPCDPSAKPEKLTPTQTEPSQSVKEQTSESKPCDSGHSQPVSEHQLTNGLSRSASPTSSDLSQYHGAVNDGGDITDTLDAEKQADTENVSPRLGVTELPDNQSHAEEASAEVSDRVKPAPSLLNSNEERSSKMQNIDDNGNSAKPCSSNCAEVVNGETDPVVDTEESEHSEIQMLDMNVNTKSEQPSTDVNIESEQSSTHVNTESEQLGTHVNTESEQSSMHVNTESEQPGTESEQSGTHVNTESGQPSTLVNTESEQLSEVKVLDTDVKSEKKQDNELTVPSTSVNTESEQPSMDVNTENEQSSTHVNTESKQLSTDVNTETDEPSTHVNTESEQPGTHVNTESEQLSEMKVLNIDVKSENKEDNELTVPNTHVNTESEQSSTHVNKESKQLSEMKSENTQDNELTVPSTSVNTESEQPGEMQVPETTVNGEIKTDIDLTVPVRNVNRESKVPDGSVNSESKQQSDVKVPGTEADGEMKEHSEAKMPTPKSEHTAPAMISKSADNSTSHSGNEKTSHDLSEKELEYLSKGMIYYVRLSKKVCPHVVDRVNTAVRDYRCDTDNGLLRALELAERKTKVETVSSDTGGGHDAKAASATVNGTCASDTESVKSTSDQSKLPETAPSSIAAHIDNDKEKKQDKTPSEDSQQISDSIPDEKNLECQTAAKPDTVEKAGDTGSNTLEKPELGPDTEASQPADQDHSDDELDMEIVKLHASMALQALQERVAIDRDAEEMCEGCQKQSTEHGEPCRRTAEDFAKMRFGRKLPVFVVCSLCRRYYHGLESLLRHQVKKHPSIQCSHFEVENGHGLEMLFYPEPSTQGVLAESVLLPPQHVSQDSYTCTRCKLTVKHYSRLRSHIINCDPNTPTAPHTRRKRPRANRHRFMEKMLPDPVVKETRTRETGGAVRDLSFRPRGHKAKPLSPASSHKSATTTSRRQPPTSTTTTGPQTGTRSATHMRARSQNWRFSPSQYGSDMSKPEENGSSRNQRRRNYELLYNPAAHVRRRERTECVDIHQCQGCRLSFRTLSLLERHTKNCADKDKILNQKPNSRLVDGQGGKKHGCHYCPKRFKYLKGVSNHYNNNFCRVRAMRLAGEGLSVVDHDHEAQLQALLKQQAWNKMENRDHTDVIQGRAQLLDDGTISHTKRKGGWPKGLKRSNKRRRNGWTYIKRRKPDGSGSETSGSPSKSTTSSATSSPGSATSVAMSELEARLREPMSQSAKGKRKRSGSAREILLAPKGLPGSQVLEPSAVQSKPGACKGKKSLRVDDLSQAPVIDRMDMAPPVKTRHGKQMSPDLEPPTLSPIPPPVDQLPQVPTQSKRKRKRKSAASDGLQKKKPGEGSIPILPQNKQVAGLNSTLIPITPSGQPILASSVNLGEGLATPLLAWEPVMDSSGTKGGYKLVSLKIPSVIPRIPNQFSLLGSAVGPKAGEQSNTGPPLLSPGKDVPEQKPLPPNFLFPSPPESATQGEEKTETNRDGVGSVAENTGLSQPQKGRKSRQGKKTVAEGDLPAATTIKDMFKNRKSPTRSKSNQKTLKAMDAYRFEKSPPSSAVLMPSTAAPTSSAKAPATSVASLLSGSGITVLPPGAMLAVLPSMLQQAPTSLSLSSASTSQAKAMTGMGLSPSLQTAVADGKVLLLDPRCLSSLLNPSSLPITTPVAMSQQPPVLNGNPAAATASQPGMASPSSPNPSNSGTLAVRKGGGGGGGQEASPTLVPAKAAVDVPNFLFDGAESPSVSSSNSGEADNATGKKMAKKETAECDEKSETDVSGEKMPMRKGPNKNKKKPKRGPPPSVDSPNGSKVKSMVMMTSPGVHTMVSLNIPPHPPPTPDSDKGEPAVPTGKESNQAADSASKDTPTDTDSGGKGHADIRTSPARAVKRKRHSQDPADKGKDCGDVHSKIDSGSSKHGVLLNVPVVERRGEAVSVSVSPASDATAAVSDEDLPLSAVVAKAKSK